MPLYQKLLATHFDWEENKIYVADAIEFIKQNKHTADFNTLFEVILDSFCIAIYHTLNNSNRADHFFEHTDRFGFAIKHAEKIVTLLNTTQSSSLYQICHELALNYNAIGVKHASKNHLNDYSMSVEYFEKAVTLYRLINDKQSLAENLYNQALSLIHLHQYQDAQPQFKQASQLLFEQSEIHLRSRCIYYQGVCKFMQNLFEQAYSDFDDALNYYQEPHLLERQGNFLYQQGNFLKNNEQFFLAKQYFLLAEKTYQHAGNYVQKNNCRYQANRCQHILLINNHFLSQPIENQLAENPRIRLTASA